MKKISIDNDVLIDWINEFINKNNNSPGLRDFYKNKGCPYNKSSILNKFGTLTDMYKILNIERRIIGCNKTDKQLLLELNMYCIKYKTTDRDVLRSKGLTDRSVYEKRFRSWSNALKLSGIDNKVKVLMKYFDNYDGTEPIQFLKNNIGENNEFTEKQYEYISKAKNLEYDTNKIRNSMNYSYIKKNFKTVSILLIACGIDPNVTYCSGNTYIAKDGHKCDSSKEVEIDNYLYKNNIKHEVHIKYPNSDYISDFKINDLYIEYAGLTDKNNYKNQLSNKIEYAKQNNIKQLVITKLDENILKQIVRAALSSDI